MFIASKIPREITLPPADLMVFAKIGADFLLARHVAIVSAWHETASELDSAWPLIQQTDLDLYRSSVKTRWTIHVQGAYRRFPDRRSRQNQSRLAIKQKMDVPTKHRGIVRAWIEKHLELAKIINFMRFLEF